MSNNNQYGEKTTIKAQEAKLAELKKAYTYQEEGSHEGAVIRDKIRGTEQLIKHMKDLEFEQKFKSLQADIGGGLTGAGKTIKDVEPDAKVETLYYELGYTETPPALNLEEVKAAKKKHLQDLNDRGERIISNVKKAADESKYNTTVYRKNSIGTEISDVEAEKLNAENTERLVAAWTKTANKISQRKQRAEKAANIVAGIVVGFALLGIGLTITAVVNFLGGLL